MNNAPVILPKSFHLKSIGVVLTSLELHDKDFYVNIYSNVKLMKYVSKEIHVTKILDNFNLLIEETKQPEPRYITYVLNHGRNKLGVFGAKLMGANALETGTILLNDYQGMGWSKKIKRAWINYAVNALNISQLCAYCRHDNYAANQLNLGLGFVLDKQFKHKNKNELINKWVLNC